LNNLLDEATADIKTIKEINDEMLDILESGSSSSSSDVDKKLIHLQTNILRELISNPRKR
jgi:hypothetical protein